MKITKINWLNDCSCGEKVANVYGEKNTSKTVFTGSEVSCSSCGNGGHIEAYSMEEVNIAWSDNE